MAKLSAHQGAADDHRPGKSRVDLGEVPGAHVDDHGEERQGDDGRLEPHRPDIGVAEDQAHDEEDEGYAEHVDVRDAHQGREAHAGVDLRDGGEVLKTVEVGNMRVAAVVAGEAALRDDRLDLPVVFRLVEAAMNPADDRRGLVCRQHSRHRPGQGRLQSGRRPVAAIGNGDIVGGKAGLAVASGIDLVDLQHREHVADAHHQERRRE